MTSPIEEFFAQLGRRRHEPLLAKASGTVRFEIAQGLCTEHWYVRVDRGDLTVSRENIEADAVVRASRELFDRVASGEEYILAALLRGEVSAEGRLPLLVLFERLLPGPEAARGQRLATSGEGPLS
ncbi:SCP2 sterol-binding domain-containing protein [Micromonospora sp. NPDC005806]|uniref:SCP2 sterol-binding domain-containing protein n=1 Tax=Micromonospora sp. NPDC005806 TaxID=3364234 RepID=UPI0036C64D4D